MKKGRQDRIAETLTWGTPALVYEMIKENPYLAIPKMRKKL